MRSAWGVTYPGRIRIPSHSRIRIVWKFLNVPSKKIKLPPSFIFFSVLTKRPFPCYRNTLLNFQPPLKRVKWASQRINFSTAKNLDEKIRIFINLVKFSLVRRIFRNLKKFEKNILAYWAKPAVSTLIALADLVQVKIFGPTYFFLIRNRAELVFFRPGFPDSFDFSASPRPKAHPVQFLIKGNH